MDKIYDHSKRQNTIQFGYQILIGPPVKAEDRLAYKCCSMIIASKHDTHHSIKTCDQMNIISDLNLANLKDLINCINWKIKYDKVYRSVPDVE